MKLSLFVVALVTLVTLATFAAALPVGDTSEDDYWHLEPLCGRNLAVALEKVCETVAEVDQLALVRKIRSISEDCCQVACKPEVLASYC